MRLMGKAGSKTLFSVVACIVLAVTLVIGIAGIVAPTAYGTGTSAQSLEQNGLSAQPGYVANLADTDVWEAADVSDAAVTAAASGVASVDDVKYASLQAAIAAAEASASKSVKLIANATAADIVVPVGVTLDIAGYDLSAANLVSYGAVINSGKGSACLKIAGQLVLDSANPAMPLANTQNAGWYHLFNYTARNLGVKNGQNTITIGYAPTFDDAYAYDVLAGAETAGNPCNLHITMDVQWSGTSLTFRFDEKLLTAYGELARQYEDTGIDAALLLKLVGLDVLPTGTVVTVKANMEAGGVQAAFQMVAYPDAKIYTVTFRDHDGTVLKTEPVVSGQAATAPEAPSRAGYTFTGWDQAFDKVTGDLVVTAQYVQDNTWPAFVLSDVEATAGAKGVAVTVAVKNNPGILGLEFDISYDDSVLTLVGAENGVTADGYGYTEPSRFKNPSHFVWDAMDCNWTQDGAFLTLLFDVSATAANGEYNVTLEFDPDYVYDGNGESIVFTVVNAAVKVG